MYRSHLLRGALCLVTAVLLTGSSVRADSISFANTGNGLYNTGTQVQVLPGNVHADQHWQQNPGGPAWLTSGSTPATIITTNLPSTWLPNIAPGPIVAGSPTSVWIQPCAPGTDPVSLPAGDYWFTTRFDLTGLDPNTAEITFRVSADNWLVETLLNGDDANVMFRENPTPNGWETYREWSDPFTLNNGFVDGWNTLSFLVRNDPIYRGGFNPTAFRLEVLGATASTPEPASAVLFAAFATVSIYGVRRKMAKKSGTETEDVASN
jgi:hypothetical protein